MPRIQWWAINLTNTLISLGVIFTSHISQFHQIARAEGECNGRQILTSITCAGDDLEPEKAKLYSLFTSRLTHCPHPKYLSQKVRFTLRFDRIIYD